MKPRRSFAQAGFTLVETMVALFILALVSSAGASLLFGATGAGKQVREREAVMRQLDIAQSLIRQDMAGMSRRAVLPLEGYAAPENLFVEPPRGERPFLRFVRSGWINPGLRDQRGPHQRVQYVLQDGQLVREASLRADAVVGTPISRRVLLNNVSGVELTVWRGGEASEVWSSSVGQPLYVLPDRVTFRIRFERGGELTIDALCGGRS